MIKDVVNVKSNIALLSKIFELLNQLNEEQIKDLLDDRVKLRLDAQINGQLEALIDEKLGVKLHEKLSALIDEKLSNGSSDNTADSLADNNAHQGDAKKSNLSKKVKTNQDKGPRMGKNKKDKDVPENSKSASNSSDVLETVASEVKKLVTKDGITDYFEKNPLKISAMKSLANKHFGVTDTRKMNVESLISGIADVVMKPTV